MKPVRPWLLARRRALRITLLTLAALALVGAGVATRLIFAGLPPVSALEERSVRPTTTILDRNGRLLYEVIDPNAGKQLSLSLDAVPQSCIDATLATEDARFYRHPGVDPIAIARAFVQNWRAGGQIVSGGSTLTQQVARTLLLDPEERYTQSLRRKLREAWLALRIEQRYTKDEILALYLNQSYYGHFAFGLEAAAQIFFAKPAAQLARSECALLAGLTQYPTGYDPYAAPEVAKARQLTVLRLMREAGRIDGTNEEAIAAEPLRYRANLFAIEAPHFVIYVQELLAQRYGPAALREGGLTVTTTLDLDLQHEAEAAVRHRLDLLNCRTPGLCTPQTDPTRRVNNAAAVVLDSRTGDILAMVGSPDYFDASIQGTVNAALSLRQPGSAIKPLTYAAALDPAWAARAGVEPLTAGTILADLPTVFGGTEGTEGSEGTTAVDPSDPSVPYVPVNYDRKAHGPVSVREALANSYNVPAVLTLDRIGVPTLQQVAAQAGISTFTGDFGLALTLGGGEVRLLELTAAYGALDDGRRLEPRAILAITGLASSVSSLKSTANAETAVTLRPETLDLRPVVDPRAAWLITDILDDDVARLPAFGGNSVLALPFAAAAKTGTTTDWRDNWTLGYSTERVVGVWVGNADNTPMRDVSGIDGAGPIWRDLMLAAHPSAPAPFTRPSGIVDADICAPSGLLATELCPRTRIEHYLDGTEPTQPDTQFVAVAIDNATGLRADALTPAARVRRRVYWNLPAQYAEWMAGQGIAPLPPGAAPAASAETPAAPLLLTSPTANTAYRLHPGAPRSAQRLEVSGRTGDGAPWASLRLLAVGPGGTVVLAQGENVATLRAWWELSPGAWSFRLEGVRAPGESATSSAARVEVEEFETTIQSTWPS